MFKRILILSAFAATFAGSASAAELVCNPAVQNWVNGSQMTCSVRTFGSKEPSVSYSRQETTPRDLPTEEVTSQLK